MTTDFDVAIIGAGPVGAILANFLGLSGLKVALIDKEDAAYHLPRAVTFDDEAMRMFQTIGLEEEMQTIAQTGLDAVFVNADGEELVRWDRPLRKTENGWYVNYRFHQPDLENVLRGALDRYQNVTTFWNWEVTSLEDRGEFVTLSGRAEGKPAEFRARYVVGCDGGRSFTRKIIGEGLEDLGFHEDWLILDFVLPEPEPDPDRNSYHYCGTARMGSKIYVGDSRKRWEWRLTEADDRSRLNDPAVAWDMVSQWLKPGEARLERTAVYTFHSTIARRWRRGRLMIGGDAAHQTPPFMGQGMVAGLRDAANLGWKLVMVVQGRAPEALLDTYQSERSPHVREYIDLTINLGRLINQTRDRVVGQTVEQTDTGRQTMSKIRPRLGPGLDMGNAGDKDGADPASAGAMFPQFDLADGSRLDDLLSYRSGLILARGADLPDALAARFEAAGIVIHRADSSDLDDWLDRAGAAAVLVRPDRYIGGLAEGPAAIAALHPEAWQITGT